MTGVDASLSRERRDRVGGNRINGTSSVEVTGSRRSVIAAIVALEELAEVT